MSEIDWSKAPEGAEYYGRETEDFHECWYRKVGDEWYCWLLNGSNEWSLTRSNLEMREMIEAPDPWTGAGLPPVGTVCEYRAGNVEVPFEYSQCNIIAHFEGESGKQLAAFTYVAHDGVVQLGRGLAQLFRPVRTQEQIEAEERERAIYAMLEIYQHRYVDTKTSIAALYDAGYRKQGEDK